MKSLHIITDLQFGSTGKGLYAGFLAHMLRPDTIITAWAPNAGHTYVDEAGLKFVNIALPSGIVANPKVILLGPGSVINPKQFILEMDYYRNLGFSGNVYIHENAAVVYDYHVNSELEYGYKIGSTMKGVGEAVIQKIRRNTRKLANLASNDATLWPFIATTSQYDELVDTARVAILEGAQGFSLSLNQGFYPYVTSRECTTHQLMSDCAIPYENHIMRYTKVYGVMRTRPIRVANRHDESGQMIGTSGPCYPDQEEIEWEALGVPPELTTVTKLPRRIFTFSKEQVLKAIRCNGVEDVFLNFCNYIHPDEVAEIARFISTNTQARVRHFGYGPSVNDIKMGVMPFAPVHSIRGDDHVE